MKALDDRALVREVLAGSADAEEELVRRLRPLAIGMARGRFGLDPHAAEEVWQEVVVRLWSRERRALEAWRGEGKLTTYLAVIVSRLCLRRRRRSERPEPAAPEAAPAPGPHQRAEERERRRAVAAAVGALSERDRLLVTLRFQDERSPAEIGRFLGLKPATARKALHDALRRLRKQLRRSRPELFEVTAGEPRDLIARELADEG